MKKKPLVIFVYSLMLFIVLSCFSVQSQGQRKSFMPGEMWPDIHGNHINAHGGGILFHEGVYYWFGESKDAFTNVALAGVACYSSTDLYNWKNEGIVMKVVEDDKSHDISSGCIIERPKVIYNEKTDKFVMWFHLELRGQGYDAARVALAIADRPTGPYTYIHSYRPNAGFWPLNLPVEEQRIKKETELPAKRWTPKWLEAMEKGYYVSRDFKGGQMSRDMTVYVDDDGKAYHIYASEENQTLHIAELSEDYQSHTGNYIRVAPAGGNEAPAIFKKDGKYFMITSGCTGWAPNPARLLLADSIMGEWTQHPNPAVGKDANITFGGQSTHILPVPGKRDAFIFMADLWRPQTPKYGGHIWLPIQFENGLPVLKWMDEWKLDVFNGAE